MFKQLWYNTEILDDTVLYELIHFWPILTSITSILTESSSCVISCTIIANLSSCLNNFIRKRENDMVLVHENQR